MKINKKKIFINSISIFLSFALLILSGFFDEIRSRRTEYLGKVIKAIELKGNRNTSDDEIMGIVQMRPGRILTRRLLDEDLKALFATQFFYYIDIKGEILNDGIKIIFDLKERPRVSEIQFVGADEVFPSDLREKIPLKEREVISPEKVTASKQMILQKYRDEGFFLAFVKAELGQVDPETNTVRVRFIIDEGEDIPVSKINIYGNQNVDTAEILGILELKEEGLFEGGNFHEAKFEKDKQKIVAFLQSRGFLDAEMDRDGTNWEIHWANPEAKDKRVIVVNYKIHEGELYYYAGYKTDHDYAVDSEGRPLFLNKENNPPNTPVEELKPVFDVDFLEKNFEYTPDYVGEVFDEGKLVRDRATMNKLYSSKGYLFAQVIPERKVIELTEENLRYYENCYTRENAEAIAQCQNEYKLYNIRKLREIYSRDSHFHGKKFVHVSFTIRENNLAYVENIIIKGNKKTQDKVIRRQLLLKPGDLFNSELVERSRQMIYNLGFFKEVNLNMRPGSDQTKMNLIIEVSEQPTGTVSMGGGYGSITGFSIFTQIGEKNLNGTGQSISGRFQFGPYQKSFMLSWTEPWIYDKPWSLSLSMFYQDYRLAIGAIPITQNNNSAVKERATYNQSALGFSIGLSHRIFVNWHHYHRYSPSFYATQHPSALVSDQILAQAKLGWRFRSEISNGILYNNLDNVFNPTNGFSFMFEIDNAGQYLGGQSHFDQYHIKADFYHTWFDYTLFGLFRSSALRKWRVVQEFYTSSVFTFIRSPKYGKQNPLTNPYILIQDRLFLGGYQSLRGWNFQDQFYPTLWQYGALDRMLFTTELRFPIEPRLLWFVIFMDAGAMYDDVNHESGQQKLLLESYRAQVNNAAAQRAANPIGFYLAENYNSYGQKYAIPPLVLNDPARLVLSGNNVALNMFKYSWGFGLRVQIPVLPLRLYFAQKLQYVAGAGFVPYQASKSFNFVFGIGDIRW